MSDLVERLCEYGANPGTPPEGAYELALKAADEIERLQDQAKGDGYVIDRQQAEIDRLTAAVEGLRQNRDLAYEKEKRLRAALEGAYKEGYYEGACDSEDYDHDMKVMAAARWLNSKAREALRDE